MSIISSEIKALVRGLGIAIILLMVLIGVAINYSKIYNFLAQNISPVPYSKAYSYNLDKNKEYYLDISTNFGTLEFHLDKTRAPMTVNNIVNLVYSKYYANFNQIKSTEDSISIGNGLAPISYTIQDEINADSLGLNTKYVRDNINMLNKSFSLNTINQNINKSLKDFYVSQGYVYSSNIESKLVQNGSLVMSSSTPNSSNGIFFISLKDNNLKYDGRNTNFGDITTNTISVLNDIERNTQNLSISSVYIKTK